MQTDDKKPIPEEIKNELEEKINPDDFEFRFEYTGKAIQIWIPLLIALIASILSVLSTSNLTGSNDSTVFILFLSVLIVMLSVYKLGLWGVLVAFLSSILYCISIKVDLYVLIFNVCANTIQALVIFLMINRLKTIDFFRSQIGKLTSYKLLLFGIGVLYTVLSVMEKENLIYIFFIILFVFNLVASIVEKNASKLLFFLAICFLPSLAGGLLNSFRYIITNDIPEFINQTMIWTLSNTILFSTYGYFLLSVLTRKQINVFKNKINSIKISTILFYLATALWNVLFYFMYLNDWLSENTVSYIFPWCVGNMFFILNLIFSLQDEILEKDSAFSWFESRAVVAENNTQMLIAIISFLLPLSASYLGDIEKSISVIFVLDITCAVVSIGLIWVPKDKINLMSLIKHLKTIFHLFTLALLLLEAIMIINGAAS